MKTKESRNITASKYWLSQAELEAISGQLSGEAKLIFQIMVATGQRFSHIKEATWQGFNANLATLDFKGLNTRLPVATTEGILALREKALSENSKIFKTQYKRVWDKVSRVYFKLGIEQKVGCLKLAKLTYARRHFETFQNKSKLARDMGLTTTRWLPKEIFKYSGPCASLVQF